MWSDSQTLSPWSHPGKLNENSISDETDMSAVSANDLAHGAEAVAFYVEQSLSENTRRAYRSDRAHFEQWAGPVPASEKSIAGYLATYADELAASTLTRRLAAIAHAHVTDGYSDPTKGPLVRATLRGIRRTRGTGVSGAKPLRVAELHTIIATMPDATRDKRDKALLALAFAGGLRRSELVAFNCEDVSVTSQGMIVQLRRSKTDQTGSGRAVAIPFGSSNFCPVRMFQDWLSAANIQTGAVFRRVDRCHRVLPQRLTGDAVSTIVKQRLNAAGIDPTGYSAHSLRAGFVTSAAEAGVPLWQIRRQTGHNSDAMAAHYIRDVDLFRNNPAAVIWRTN